MFSNYRPAPADYLITGIVLALALLGLVLTPDPAGPTAVALTFIQALPLLGRREAPAPVLAVILAATAAYFLLDAPFVTTAFLGLLVAVYSIASYADATTARIGVGASVVSVLGFLAIDALLGRDVIVFDAVAHAGVIAVAWVLGDRAKTRRAYTRSLEERAAQAEKARMMESAAAVATERTRIARELHDVVAHSVSTMVLHAAAAKQVLEEDPAAARGSLDLIENTGRGAVAELRTVVQALRTEEDEGGEVLRPQPRVASIAELVERTEAAGVELELTVEGETRPLPSSVDVSAYRVVQESLTNMIKHSRAGRGEVIVRYSEDHLVVHVTDEGRGAEATATPGFGIAGMRERVELLGGRFHAGTRPAGGFEVLASFPIGRPG